MQLKIVLHIATALACSFYITGLRAQPSEQARISDASIAFAAAIIKDQRMVDQSIVYAYSGDQDKPGLLFIHGTPGSWAAFETYLASPSLQEEYFMVSVDRLGWGKSAISKASIKPSGKSKNNTKGQARKKRVAGDFELQARSIGSVMAKYPNKKWLLIGHSLGASIAPKVAIIEPDKVSALLLLAGSLSPKLGKPRWYNRIANTIVAKWLLPKNLHYSNDEIMALRKELEVLDEQIKSSQLNTQVVVIQGLKDRLVSPKNADYAKRNWRQHFADLKVIELAEASHFIPWQQSHLVVQTIRQFEH
jgi:pimeloyl-ACP methyl ester carboxylesterase